MKEETEKMLAEAKAYCDDNDKSTEFMLEYMQNFANVSLDCVFDYLEDTSKHKYKIIFKDTLSGAKQSFDKELSRKEVASVKRDIKAKQIRKI